MAFHERIKDLEKVNSKIVNTNSKIPGELVEDRPLTELQQKVLDSLDRPKRIIEIVEEIGVEKQWIYGSLKFLEKKGLIDKTVHSKKNVTYFRIVK